MKKLLLGAILTIGYAFGANAQVQLCTTTFPNNVIPVGWTQQLRASAPTNGGWQFSNTVPGTLGNTYMPPSGNGFFAFVDDIDSNLTAVANHDTLYTNVFSCAGYNHVFLSFDIWFQGYYNQNNNDAEKVTVAVSTDGGHTWTAPITNPYGGWTTSIYDLSSLIGNQANVKLAFTYYDGGTQLVGMGLDNVSIYSPLSYDLSVTSQNTPFLMQVGKPYNFSGSIVNFGGDSIVSMDMNYSVDNIPFAPYTISGIVGFNGLATYNWSDGNAFTPPLQGIYTVKFWANNLNGGNTDQNHANDTLTATFWAIDSVKTRQAVYEECTGQSCVFCMIAAPNMDSVYDNNATNSNIVRYHVPIPNRDLMYNANPTPSIQRIGYYEGNNQYAPFGALDGTSLNPSTYLTPDPAQRYSSTTVQADDALGSPFKIAITSAKYIASRDSFYVSANITAYAAFPAGLTAQVALTIDSITYKYDLSTDDPAQEFQPCACVPGSTGSNLYNYPDAPDYYYDYELKFTHVCEEMFPNSGLGTSLAAFTAGQTQTISFGWKKNHQWGAYYPAGPHRDSDYYDSSSTGQFVVFVQTNNAIPADGIPAQYIFQSANAPVKGMTDLGIQGIANNGTPFTIYPNPTNNNATLAFSLTQDQNVNVEVFNMLGEQVYTNNEGMLSTGQHTIAINGSTLQNGLYLVRFITDGGTSTQKLLIQR